MDLNISHTLLFFYKAEKPFSLVQNILFVNDQIKYYRKEFDYQRVRKYGIFRNKKESYFPKFCLIKISTKRKLKE